MVKANNPQKLEDFFLLVESLRVDKKRQGIAIVRFLVGVEAYDILIRQVPLSEHIFQAYSYVEATKEGEQVKEIIPQPVSTLMGLRIDKSVLVPTYMVYAELDNGLMVRVCSLEGLEQKKNEENEEITNE